jgi:hypothetical protein
MELLIEATLNICSIIYEFSKPWSLQLCVESPSSVATITAVTVEPGHRVVPYICAPLNLEYL